MKHFRQFPKLKPAPLRKIVGTKLHPTIPGILVEVLECGHEQRQKEDIYGPTNAYARRCRQCRQNVADDHVDAVEWGKR